MGMFCLLVESNQGGFDPNGSTAYSFFTGSDPLLLKCGWSDLSICAIPSLNQDLFYKATGIL